MRSRHPRVLLASGATLLFAAASIGLAFAAGDSDGSRGPVAPTVPPQVSAPAASPDASARKGTAGSVLKKKKKSNRAKLIKRQKRSDLAPLTTQPLEGYRTARALVLDGKYAEAIVAFKALHRDDHPEVANYIGFASRKLGNYEDAKIWYEKALASDPNHTRTWQYYGMWHLEQGNALKAQDHLEKIRLICGSTACEDYVKLKAALEGNGTY